MSDITELAQSLKAAANTTADAIDRLKAFPGDELIDLSQHEGEQVDIDIATLNQWYELSSPANVLALVEALEKAQRANAAQDDHINQQQDRINKLEEGCKRAAKRINSWRRLAKQSIAEQEKCVDELDATRQRIVELDRKNCELDSLTQRWAVERAENADRIAELESHKAALLKFIRDSCYVFDGADEDISDAYVDAITSGLMPKLESVTACNPPLFWVRVKSDGGYEGPIHDSKLEEVRKKSGEWLPLTLAGGIPELESRTVTAAASDVLAERQRQVTAEGWTAERDDGYQNSELADAAACYAIHAHNQGFSTPAHWPWSQDWWKQTSPRRDLVKAGALILAEIERLDRAAGIKVEAE